jgi:hypothetical protein
MEANLRQALSVAIQLFPAMSQQTPVAVQVPGVPLIRAR